MADANNNKNERKNFSSPIKRSIDFLAAFFRLSKQICSHTMSHFYCCCCHDDFSGKMSVFVWMVSKEFTRHKISSQKLSRSHAHLGWRVWESLLIWFSATDRYPSQGGRSNFLVTQFAIESSLCGAQNLTKSLRWRENLRRDVKRMKKGRKTKKTHSNAYS